jgi:phage baseplate assembly protein V
VSALARAVRLMVGRAVLSLVKDSLKMQGVQLTALSGETLDDVERFEDYGLTSKPVAGAEAVIASVGGVRDHAVVVALADRRYRPRGVMADGDVALYTKDDTPTAAHASAAHRLALVASGKKIVGRGDEISLKVGSATLTITASSLKLEHGSALVEITSSGVTINGTTVNIQAKGDYKAHTHGGVQAGGSQTLGVT